MSKSNSKISETYNSYVQNMRKLADVEHSIAILSWDKEVNLPTKGANIRGQQVATLAGIAYEIFTNDAFGATLETLHSKQADLDPKAAKNIANTLKEYQRTKKYSKAFVVRRSQLTSAAYHAWLKARSENDFKVFAPALSDMIDLKKEEVDIIGYDDHPYDALLDIYEPGAKTKELDILFQDVKEQLVEFVNQINNLPPLDDSFLHKFYQKDKQWEFGLEMLRQIGYDFEAGRQDLSPHPFTTTFGASDVRVTTRIDEHNFNNMTWSCIHEGGHALYEQGLPEEAYGLPTGKYISLGIHESQSRLWENNVGRSLSFWKAHYPSLQNIFPANLSKVALRDFYNGINKVTPSLIRTESDELHYHFHVLIRFEIEKGLIEGNLATKDLRDIWNDTYKKYLGLEVPNDKEGVLQDIHWSHGSLGYFPTYSLGSFYAAQFYEQAKKDIPNLEKLISAGDTSPLLEWLRKNIHQYGQFYTASTLCKKITGEPLNFRYFMQYAKEKYSAIYGVEFK